MTQGMRRHPAPGLETDRGFEGARNPWRKASNSIVLPGLQAADSLGTCGAVQTVGFTSKLDDFGMVEESVENGGCCGDVVEEFAPFFDGAVGGHEGGSVFVTAHDQLQEYFPGLGRQGLEPHIINDEQVDLEVPFEDAVQLGRGTFGLKVANEVKNRTVKDGEVGLDGL